MHRDSSILRLFPLSITLALILASPVLALTNDAERLIGWNGDTFNPKDAALPQGSQDQEEPRHLWVQKISEKPRAFIFRNFLSDAESSHVIKLARHQMKRSTVVGGNDKGVVDSVRTSAGTFLRRNEDKVISAIEHRLALLTHLPPSHQEDMQVLRYGPTNKYGPHVDGLARVASVLIYLVAPISGGETTFVDSTWLHPEMEQMAGNLSECARGHVTFKPKRGDALMFFDTTTDYTSIDQHSMHTGCPVVEGVKWNAVKWIHGIPFRGEDYEKTINDNYSPLPDPGFCVDLDSRCKDWEAGGECTKNPGFMVGSGSGLGGCRASCKSCEQCTLGDEACYVRNREAGGFLVVDDAELLGQI